MLVLLLVYGPALFWLGERMGQANAVLSHLPTCTNRATRPPVAPPTVTATGKGAVPWAFGERR